MKYKLIGCEAFTRPVYLAAANSKNIIDLEFTKIRSHLKPDELRREIQNSIDRSTEQYDAVLLGFGLCGNSTAGLVARSVPLVIPRAHDCCTIFLGSRSAFQEHFRQTLSAQWSTSCYYERYGGWYSDNAVSLLSKDQNGDYAGLVEKYGEENARYIWETLNVSTGIDFLTYIEVSGIADNNIKEAFVKHAADSGKKLRCIEGSTRLIDKLLAGEWTDEEFLLIPPGAEIIPIYDHDRVMGIQLPDNLKET
jgi:hypothetical protein